MDAILPDLGKALIGLGPGGILAFIFWRQWQASEAARDTERTAATARYDTLLAMLLKLVPDSIKSDNENVAALRGVEAGLGALKAAQERIERKVGA